MPTPALTTAQLQTLKSDIAANTNQVSYQNVMTAINALPNNSDANFLIAQWYNGTANPAYTVWRNVAMDTVLGLITFANMTPVDTCPTILDLDVQVWIARALACQGKQFNLQNLIIGKTTAPMKQANYRNALQDALTNLPSGANGALLGGNWPGVRDSAKQSATNAEKLFATGAGTSGSPSDLSIEGTISGADVETARNLP